MKLKNISIFIILIMISGLSSLAQNPNRKAENKYQIIGKLVDENKQALEYATIRVFNQVDSALVTGNVSNAQGKFSIPVKQGTYYVVVQFISFIPEIFSNINVGPASVVYNLKTIQLRSDAKTLDEVKVMAEKSTMELQLDKRVFNVGKDLANLGGNATQILDNIPSVTVDVDGNVSLRGSQNVRILINGRPSGLTGIAGSEGLRLLQGNMVERVEVITNPSARYDAEGEVGIINIILKKEKRRGVNGSFDVNAGYPVNFGGAFNLNYRANWINFFTSYGINYREGPGSGNANQRFFDENGNTTSSFITTRDRIRGGWGNTIRVGADVFINENNIFTMAGLYRRDEGDNRSDITYKDFNGEGVLTSTSIRTQDEKEPGDNVELSLNYLKKFARKDHEWTTNFKWILSDELESADLYEANISTGETPIQQKSSNTEDEEIFLFQSDYVQPFAKDAKFEAGVKASLRLIDNDFLVQQLNENNQYEALPEFDNRFIYEENVYAAYAMIGNKWGQFSAQGGLRAEYTDIKAALENSDANSDRDYLNLFPSVFLAYEVDKANTFQLSYSRRLSRPSFRDLLPFSNFSDSRNFRAGNPNLDPEFTHSFEAGYLRSWKSGNVLSSVYYRRRSGVIERITLLDSEVEFVDIPDNVNIEGQNITINVNLSLQNAYGLEFTFTQDISEAWTLNGSANFYTASTSGSFEGKSFDNQVTTLNGRLQNKINIFKFLDFQANLNYQAPESTPQGRRKSITTIDLAMSKDILKGNGTFTLSIRDLLNNRKFRGITRGDNFYTESEFQWRARQATLNFSYRLNQQKKRGRDGKRG